MPKPLFCAAYLTVFLCPTAALACPLVPAPRTSLTVDTFYADRDGSVVDPSRRKRRDNAVAVYEKVVRQVQASADTFMMLADGRAGDCALRQLATWAAAAALTGTLDSNQAEYERNWYLAGFALAYLKLKPLASGRQKTEIENWLRQMSEGTSASLASGKIPGNNLSYWAGLALAATGLASGSKTLMDNAHLILIEGLNAVSPSGTLEQELHRGSRSLSYHVFAAAPLVLLAYIAEVRGAAFDKEALARLGEAISSGLDNPAAFAAATQAEQERPAHWNLAWTPAYRRIIPTTDLPDGDRSSHFLGGNVRMTIDAIQRASNP